MKEKFISPEVEITRFPEDIVTASSGENNRGDGSIELPDVGL